MWSRKVRLEVADNPVYRPSRIAGRFQVGLEQACLPFESNASCFAQKNRLWTVRMIILGSLGRKANPCNWHGESFRHDLEEPIEKRCKNPAAAIDGLLAATMPHAAERDLRLALGDDAAFETFVAFAKPSPFVTRDEDGTFAVHALIASTLLDSLAWHSPRLPSGA